MPRLVLPAPLRAQLESEARAACPRECCGLIEGARGGEAVEALALHPTRNLSPDPGRFEIDPAQHIHLLRVLRGTDRAIVGCYHSHPNGRAELSARDREWVTDDGFVWLIAALNGGETRLAAFSCGAAGTDAISPLPLAPIV